MVKALLVIAPRNFRDEELFETKNALENAGIETVIASKNIASATGMLGGIVSVDIPLNKVNVADYGAVVFIGGGGSAIYFQDKAVLDLARDAYKSCGVVAAICIAPTILANAGLLNGKRATAFPSEKANLEKQGAIYTEENVVADGKIITADGPRSSKLFGRKIADMLV